MITAAAYILKVPDSRHEVLLGEDATGWHSEVPSVGEPVARFTHSKRAPLIVFGCFDDNAITHFAAGRKGASAGTDVGCEDDVGTATQVEVNFTLAK